MTDAPQQVEVIQVDCLAARASWNVIADEFNQWDTLSLEEQVSWQLAFARHLTDRLRRSLAGAIATGIRAGGPA